MDPKAAALANVVQQLPDVFCQGLFQQLRATLDTFTTEVVTPSETERLAKRELFNSFAEFLRKAMQDRIAIAVAGSTAYEVDAKNSDLDVVLLTSYGSPNYVLQSVVHYLTMTQAVQAKSWPLRNVQLQLVDSARVPVLVVTTPKGLVCDVSVNTVNSIKHTEYFKRVLTSTPNLRPLLRLVKYWTKARKLPAAKEGGLPGIVWMILACTYGSCPTASFFKAILGADAPATRLPSHLLPSLDATVPIFARLFRFFSLCSSRDLMSRTISCSERVCAPKSRDDVCSRVTCAASLYGVWDEVVSVEDPSACCGAAVSSELSSTHWSFVPDQGPAFDPGGSKDLASKTSAATWLVYLFELRRAHVLTTKIIVFIDEARRRVRKLPQMMASRRSSSTTAKAGYLTNAASELNGHDFVAKTFRQLVAALFKETVPDRYLLPGCDEQLRQVLETENRPDAGAAENLEEPTVDIAWGADSVTVRGITNERIHPFCFCCSQATTGFSLILCHGRVHLVRLTSICTDWSTWWTRSFLSRRDSRSVVHGILYTVLAPKDYKATLEAEGENLTDGYREVALPPSHFPAQSAAAFPQELFADTRAVLPHLLLPVRRQADLSPVEVLFHPCHFVCRIRAWQVPHASNVSTNVNAEVPRKQASSASSASSGIMDESASWRDRVCSAIAEEVYYAESDEVNLIREMTRVSAEAPWYETASYNEEFQPSAAECSRCGIDGESLLHLPGIYDPTLGPIQPTSAVEPTIWRAAWNRWDAHVKHSRAAHARPRDAAQLAAAQQPLKVVPELLKATQLLTATLEGLQLRTRRLKTTRRSQSMPPK